MTGPASATIPSLSTPSAMTEGEDLLGWSALPLLANIENGDWLFVLDRSTAYRSHGSIADARFTEVRAGLDQPWPFSERALAGVVINGDAFGGGPNGFITRLLAEAYRCTTNARNVLIVCRERKAPRRLRDLRDLFRQTADSWREGMTGCARSPQIAGYAGFEGSRLEVLVPADASNGMQAGRRGTRIVLRDARPPEVDRDAVQSMISSAARDAGLEFRLDRIAVRKIGKTAVFLTDRDGRGYIMRIARSPIAGARARRNFEALRSMQASGLSADLIARIPRAVGHGTCGPYAYYVESRLDGTGGPSDAARRENGWAVEAATYITNLHAATAECVDLADADLRRLVLEPIERLATACASTSADRVLRRLADRCEKQLRGRRLPLVQTHGDFAEPNCLFDDEGHLTGVVDWEVSDRRGLPFIDLLQLMPIAGGEAQTVRWERFDAWIALSDRPERVTEDPVMGSYVRSLRVEPETIPALVVAQWVTHAADRAAARRNDQRWMRLRVWQPLETLGRMLCD